MSTVFGCVDGVIDNELRGWIVNLDRPSRMEAITCTGGAGGSLRFHPFALRDDVNASLGFEGVFGFAIPIDLLRPLAGPISVTDQHGALLSGGLVDIGTPPRPAADGCVTLFLHISKTAGTSLRNTLLQAVPAGERLLIYPGAVPGIPTERFHQISLAQRNRLRWVFGHCKFGLDRHIGRPARYVTFIREPRSRLQSNFDHHAAAGTVFEIDGDRMHATTVINEGLSEEFDNVMTRVIAGLGECQVPLGQVGDDEVELALGNVRRHFLFVGRQEQADADTRLLQDHLGLPHRALGLDNVTPRAMRYSERDVAGVDWPRVMDRNAADCRLCERLEQEGLLSRLLGLGAPRGGRRPSRVPAGRPVASG